MTALPSIKLTAMPWGVISAGGGDHHPHPCGLGLKPFFFSSASLNSTTAVNCGLANMHI